MGAFVVYELLDPRATTAKFDRGLPFYVGEGSHQRAKASGTVGGSRKQIEKRKVITDILAAGLKIISHIVAEFETKEEARDYEASYYDRLILVYDLKLTNKMPPIWVTAKIPIVKQRQAANIFASDADYSAWGKNIRRAKIKKRKTAAKPRLARITPVRKPVKKIEPEYYDPDEVFNYYTVVSR